VVLDSTCEESTALTRTQNWPSGASIPPLGDAALRIKTDAPVLSAKREALRVNLDTDGSGWLRCTGGNRVRCASQAGQIRPNGNPRRLRPFFNSGLRGDEIASYWTSILLCR
jgi:hypothetical protein